jgi:hypothetical protein
MTKTRANVNDCMATKVYMRANQRR